ncbi:hypothetical protein JY96_21740 [Aquabacterium sp. NJ1]|uniref:hypothetical protein n=1 Tax=Aquabacterium sp. NJ1 TaxID=1538295 RepID=UPI00052C018E|nr:hypothetical protein [Aquabacterium sp. NJ1]KGM38549.1 hypothetical protein JY96_21740 [Aquabacterium sp. NJ1]
MTVKRTPNSLSIASVLFLLLLATGAQAEKLKLVCNVDIETNYSTGNTTKGKEKIQVDIELVKNQMFISTNGVDIGFSMSTTQTDSDTEKMNSSDADMFELSINRGAKPESEVERSEYVKIDRNSGILFYRYIGKLTKTATGSCTKLDQKKRMF